ncbi:MAG TPA: hypothetical protein VE172_12020 [Stackebrandtia sp.]|jgi:hypothetical protein|uniref:hypothetical protein n=1 Tax=Stackebrandtia sp. TaxID=2023065 RepID=UPI002D4D0A91|nr:hypothetical protein [Stackebrandtia sp.]HZE39526.1 hypothetical protein [Stackebrandtia sp.]
MTRSIIAIGRTLGPCYDDKGEFAYVEILIGDELERLTFNETGVWVMAHSNPRAHYETRFDRDALRRAVHDNNDKLSDRDLEHIIDKLIGMNALVEVDLANDPLEPFLREYILMPTASSFGNSPTDPDLYAIGNNGEEQLSVDSWTRILWAGSHRDGSIWNGCALLAAEYPDETPESVAGHLAEMLPVIVASECGYLEPVHG